MQINKAIRQVMKLKGISLTAMATALWGDEPNSNGKQRRGNDVSARLNNANLSFDRAVEMLNILGYEVVIQEKRAGCRRADQIVIDQVDEMKIDLNSLSND